MSDDVSEESISQEDLRKQKSNTKSNVFSISSLFNKLPLGSRFQNQEDKETKKRNFAALMA
jgi:hypothetical protein